MFYTLKYILIGNIESSLLASRDTNHNTFYWRMLMLTELKKSIQTIDDEDYMNHLAVLMSDKGT